MAEQPPDLVGRGGDAWEMTYPTIEGSALVAAWLVRAPKAHPIWEWWMISVIHLREAPRIQPAEVRVPGATHEILIASLDPRQLLPSPKSGEPMPFMLPIDVIEQFKVDSDAHAKRLAWLAAEAATEGLSPDQDFRAAWKRVVAHFVERVRGLKL